MYYTLEDYVRRETGIKVFVSWSGNKSRKIAKAVKDFLHKVVQAIDP